MARSGSRQPSRDRGKQRSGSSSRGRSSSKKGSSSSKKSKPKANEPPPAKPRPPQPKRRYSLLIFDTLYEAAQAKERIEASCAECDRLNVVIREEGLRDLAEIETVNERVKVYQGAAWTLIHERRRDDGWYNEMQE